MDTTPYHTFLARKTGLERDGGITPPALPSFLYDFQASLVEWALRKGRAAIFADCGLGKTPMQLVWADAIAQHARKPVLILTPLAVGHQTQTEAEKFGIDAQRSKEGTVHFPLTITNYERLHYFTAADFAGVVVDESSCLKNFDGVRRTAITDFLKRIPYRLLCTATPAPNDYPEIGTSSEALGGLGHMDMLTRFFTNKERTSAPRRHSHYRQSRRQDQDVLFGSSPWRFKGHAEVPFWKWVCSWARALRKPSDMGFDDTRFVLPPLIEKPHQIASRSTPDGMLFSLPAHGLAEQRSERRRTLHERCEYAASLVAHTQAPAIVWCHLNSEGDMLRGLIPDGEQISGQDDDDTKEAKLTAFLTGQTRVLITKPVIGAWGLNLQHCAHVVYFPDHSYERYYQSIRRCWRFGQQHPVTVDLIMTEGDQAVMQNMQRKAVAADRMLSRLVAYMHESLSLSTGAYGATATEVPSWL